MLSIHVHSSRQKKADRKRHLCCHFLPLAWGEREREREREGGHKAHLGWRQRRLVGSAGGTQPELDFPTLAREIKRLRRDALIWMSAEDKIVANVNVVTFLELPHVVRRLRGDSTLHAKDAFNEESQWAGVPMFNTFKHFALTISWSTACEESKFNKYKFRASKHAAHLQATRVADMLWCAEGPPLGPSVTKDPPWSKTDFYPKKI